MKKTTEAYLKTATNCGGGFGLVLILLLYIVLLKTPSTLRFFSVKYQKI